jgi:hypothetical protein
MKLIATITLVLICSFTTATGQYNLTDPKLFATGRLELDIFYDSQQGTFAETYATKYGTIQPQMTKITNQDWVNNGWVSTSRSFFNAPISNCSQPYSIYYGLPSNGFDSILYVNGRRSEVVYYEFNANAQKVIYQRNKYFYGTNGRLDSLQLKSFDPASLDEFTYRFSYDAQGRMSFTTSNNQRRFFVYDNSGNITRFVYEGYDNSQNKWVLNAGYDLTWSAGKITTLKTTSGTDSIRFVFNYTANTTNIKNMTGERKALGGNWIQTSDLVNIAKNAKGYPTRLDYRVLNTQTGILADDRVYEYGYYPNDTVVYQRGLSYPGITAPRKYQRETYEYCGIPAITSTAEIPSLNFSIYPNPTHHVLNVEIPENTEGVSIEIINTIGHIVATTNRTSIDVSGLSSGLYFVRVKQKDRVGVQRFVKHP